MNAPANLSPYVELVFDMSTMSVVPGTRRYKPDPNLFLQQPTEVKLVSDPSGKVVVRGLDPRTGMGQGRAIVIGTATWREGQLLDRAVFPGLFADHHWAPIDGVLRHELGTALSTGVWYDASARDGGVLELPPAPAPKPGLAKRALTAIATVVLAAVIIVVAVIYRRVERAIEGHDRKDGRSCQRNLQCESEWCNDGQCQAPRRDQTQPLGANCAFDGQCQSFHCVDGACRRLK